MGSTDNPRSGRVSFIVRIESARCSVEPNAAALMELGLPPDAAPAFRCEQLIASLTGRRFHEEMADLLLAPDADKSIPVLLLGGEERVVPAMLECRVSVDHVLAHAIKIGDRDVLSGGFIDPTSVLHAAVEVAPGSIITIDELGSILSFNVAAQTAFGYRAEEVVGRNVSVLMNATDSAVHDDYLRRHLHTGERHAIGGMRIVEARRKNGDPLPVELYVDEVRMGDRRLYVGFLRDISGRRELQAETATLQRELIHVTRLASMGEMAAALAHELNQPLTAIAAYAETARLNLAASTEPPSQSARDNLAKVTAQALRAGEVIRRMRQLATGGAGQRDPEDLNLIVREAVALATIGAKTLGVETIVFERAALPAVVCDRIQIQQVIINLVRNAIDSFEEETAGARAPGRARRVVIETGVDDFSARVSVRDTGHGVPPELQDRLFESFLTTKELGVGLGLPISRMIIESHGGKLWFDPQSVGGATFHFTLPLQKGHLET